MSYLKLVEADTYADWEAAYLDNVDRLYRLMYSPVGNRPDAEDLTAEVFKAALGPLRLNSSKGEVRAYLLIAARTVLASHWRRKMGQPVTFIEPDTDIAALDEPSEPDDGEAARQDRPDPRSTSRSLPADSRASIPRDVLNKEKRRVR